MPLPRNYTVIPTISPTTPSGAVGQDYIIRENRTSNEQTTGISNFSVATTIIATTQIEGVDFPFYTRDSLARAYPGRNYRVGLANRLVTVVQSTWGLGTSLPMLDAPADTFPILAGKINVYPAGLAARKRSAALRAAFSVSDAPGAWIEAIPTDSYTVTVCAVLSEIQAHLLETVNDGVSMGSGLWTMPEVVTYINNRISRFLMETGVIQYRTTIPVNANQDIINLPEDLIDLRRTAWTVASGTTVLPRGDSLQADVWTPSWDTTSGSPQMSLQVPEKSLELRLAPLPSANGTLDILYVKDLPNVTNDCSLFGIPDEWTVYIKWGVLSDMLAKEGEANDPQRAAYAEKRYSEGVTLAKLYLGTNQ